LTRRKGQETCYRGKGTGDKGQEKSGTRDKVTRTKRQGRRVRDKAHGQGRGEGTRVKHRGQETRDKGQKTKTREKGQETN
jgi:hypothetical protein